MIDSNEKKKDQVVALFVFGKINFFELLISYR